MPLAANVDELIHNLSLATAVSSMGIVFFTYGKMTPLKKHLLSGIYFGLSAILLMKYSQEIAPGIIYDPRQMPLCLSGFIGGWPSAAIAAAISGLYRVQLGGPGVYGGLWGILCSALLGTIYAGLLRRSEKWQSPYRLFLLSLTINLFIGFTPFLIPGGSPVHILKSIWWVLLFLYPPLLTLLLFIFTRLWAEKRQRELLEEKERFERATLSNIHEAIICTDLMGKVTYMNPSAESLTGWNLEEALGKHIDEVFRISNEESGMPVSTPVERVLKEGTVVGLGNHTFLRSKDGRTFPISDSASPIRDQREEITGVVLVFKDESVERNILRELEASHNLLKGVYESMQHGIFVITQEGHLLDCNSMGLRLFGLSEKSELSNKNIFHFFPRKQPDGSWSIKSAREIFKRALEEKRVVTTEALLQRVDGTPFFAYVSLSSLELSEGKKDFFILSISDITEKKKLYDTLYEEREQMLSIFDAIDQIIYVSDPETYEILFVNKKLRELFHKDPTGKICYKEFQGKEVPCDFCTNEIIKRIKPEPFYWEHYNPQLNGHYYIIDRIIRWSDGRDVRFELAIDITEIKRAEEERKALETQLAQAQRLESIGRLASGIAHDFNNILGVIMGRAQLARQRVSDERLKRDLNQILEASNRAAGIIGQILAFARKQRSRPMPCNLNRLIYQSLKVLGSIVGEDIDIKFEQEEGLWKVMVDPVQVDQILSNLIVNAKDALSGQGKITIRTQNVTIGREHPEFRKEMLPGDYVLLSVSDTGHGIPEDIQKKIFEPFFTTKEPGKGTGLGLATVYGIVKQNNGYIYVESKWGQGATFKIFLPAAEGKDSGIGELKKGTGTAPNFKGRRVLLVEDDPQLLTSTEEMLLGLGFEVTACSSPREALNKAYNISTDLLITDVVMPEMYGTELYTFIKRLIPDIKVLFISGHGDVADLGSEVSRELLEEALDEGRAFLEKPFGVEEISGKLNLLLNP